MNTGPPVRKSRPIRYEREKSGDLVHIDVKKLGRIPTEADGGYSVGRRRNELRKIAG